MALLYAVLLSVICVFAITTATEVVLCPESQASVCELLAVRIDPCRKVPCLMRKGSNATISFDFKPHFRAEKLKTLPYYNEIEYSEFGSTDGCLFTKCPTEPGVTQTMNYALKIGKKLPNGIFTFKWKVWNEDNKDESCCFMPTIKLKN